MTFREHHNLRKIEINYSKVLNENNEDNFREILRYRVQGYIEMKAHLESSDNIKYTSHRIQNDVIDTYNIFLLNKVVSRVNAAKCFLILTDVTVDILELEQVSVRLCVKYINFNTLKLTDGFLKFMPISDMSGNGIANLILRNFCQFGFNTQY